MTTIAPPTAGVGNVEYTSVCDCAYCPECGSIERHPGESCTECGAGTEAMGSDDCHGCHNEDLDELDPIVSTWVDANDSPFGIARVIRTSATDSRVNIITGDDVRNANPTDFATNHLPDNEDWQMTLTVRPHTSGECHAHVSTVGRNGQAFSRGSVELHPMIGCADENGEF